MPVSPMKVAVTGIKQIAKPLSEGIKRAVRNNQFATNCIVATAQGNRGI